MKLKAFGEPDLMGGQRSRGGGKTSSVEPALANHVTSCCTRDDKVPCVAGGFGICLSDRLPTQREG
jgi:hypothetical protein